MTCDVGLGDVIRAWRALGASDDAERRAIARLLGFDLRGDDDEEPGEPVRPVRPPRPPREPVGAGDAVVPEAPRAAANGAIALDLVPFTDAAANPFALPADGLAMPEPEVPIAVEPLFEPRWQRAITGALSKRSAAVGEIDHRRAIELIARREPIVRLPRRRRLVSVTEVVVAIDTRGTLAWFAADADELVARLDAVTRAQVEARDTDGAPVLGRSTEEIGIRYASLDADELGDAADAGDAGDARDRIRIGANGRVLGLTDLGLGSPWTTGDPRRVRGWIALAAAVRARGASLVIVTPVPPARVPPALARRVACIHWDRRTRPSLVHRLLKVRR